MTDEAPTADELITEFEKQRDHWQRRYMDVVASSDRWREKADRTEAQNRDLLDVLRAHGKHPGASHTLESLGYSWLMNAEELQCECGHRAMGITDEMRASSPPD